ncbi:hypothetical protein BDR04DRAFT_578871 [Suillus decipiens]|nr:hypothetical protein BDR04DRAFT_578871 [Suillus decipiens]
MALVTLSTWYPFVHPLSTSSLRGSHIRAGSCLSSTGPHRHLTLIGRVEQPHEGEERLRFRTNQRGCYLLRYREKFVCYSICVMVLLLEMCFKVRYKHHLAYG